MTLAPENREDVAILALTQARTRRAAASGASGSGLCSVDWGHGGDKVEIRAELTHGKDLLKENNIIPSLSMRGAYGKIGCLVGLCDAPLVGTFKDKFRTWKAVKNHQAQK